MAYDFPASPSVGTLFAPAGGPTWQWNGQGWAAVSPAGLVPEAPVDGQNYVRRNGLWVLAPGTAEAKNRIVNGAMAVSQELGSTATSTSGGYPVDQWLLLFGGISGVGAARSATTTPDNSPWGLITNTTTAKPSLAAGDYWFLQQPIEGIRVADFQWGTAGAKNAVLRFNFWNGGAAATYGVSISNGAANNRSWVSNFSAPSGWSRQVFSIPGDTTGTWAKDNTKAWCVNVALALGSTYVGAAGWNAGAVFGAAGMSNAAAATTGFFITDVGLYLDPQNTGIAPPWQMPDEAQELIACQRYWETGMDGMDAYGIAGGAISARNFFKVWKRIVPAVSATSQAAVNVSSATVCDTITNDSFRGYRLVTATGPGAFRDYWIANARM